jgi:hypothetical protein
MAKRIDRRRPHADARAGAAAARTGTTSQILGEPFFMDPLKRAIADAELLATDMAARAYTLMIKKL